MEGSIGGLCIISSGPGLLSRIFLVMLFRVFELGKGLVPTYPSIGLQIIRIEEGEVIDVIVQNNPANSFNGDYTPAGVNRTATEQHPFQ